MDAQWIGRRLMQAAGALGERYAEEKLSPATPALVPLARPLLREVGRALLLEESDPRLPLLRTRVVWVLPLDYSHRSLAVAFNALGVLVRSHLRELPGLSIENDRFVFEALRHGARTLLCLRHELLQGRCPPALKAQFGGELRLVRPL